MFQRHGEILSRGQSAGCGQHYLRADASRFLAGLLRLILKFPLDLRPLAQGVSVHADSGQQNDSQDAQKYPAHSFPQTVCGETFEFLRELSPIAPIPEYLTLSFVPNPVWRQMVAGLAALKLSRA
jgi:hypothetical protein